MKSQRVLDAKLARRRYLARIVLAGCLLVAGCAQLKQCAYEGFGRDRWQQPERVITELDIKPGAVVADLGSGGGYFTFRLADAAGPGGKVYAVDVDRDMTELVAARAADEGRSNVEVIFAKPEDPLLPKVGVDLVFTCNTYHHIDDRISYFANVRRYLRPEGRIAIIEFDRRAWLGALFGHATPKQSIEREMNQAGYELQDEFNFLDRQSFLIFVPKS